MRREYVETISSHAAPSPARHLLTSSAPSPTGTAPAPPTSRPFDSLRGLPELAGRAGGQPVVKRALRPPKGESSSPAGAACGGGAAPRSPGAPPPAVGGRAPAAPEGSEGPQVRPLPL